MISSSFWMAVRTKSMPSPVSGELCLRTAPKKLSTSCASSCALLNAHHPGEAFDRVKVSKQFIQPGRLNLLARRFETQENPPGNSEMLIALGYILREVVVNGTGVLD